MDETINKTTKGDWKDENKLEIKVTGCKNSAQSFVNGYCRTLAEDGKRAAHKWLDWKVKNMLMPWTPSFEIEIDGRQYVHLCKDVD